MSFVLTLWAQPAGTPLPRDVDEAAAQLSRVMKQPPGPAQPVLAAFVAAVSVSHSKVKKSNSSS